MQSVDVIILGAGAAGMFCAIEAGRRGRHVVLIDHARKAGEKIRISGGGRCNFTNLRISRPDAVPFGRIRAFALKSALNALHGGMISPPWSMRATAIPYHEKTLGQLFCDRSSRDIIEHAPGRDGGGGRRVCASPRLGRAAVERNGSTVTASRWSFEGRRVHGSRPRPGRRHRRQIRSRKMGATGFGYRHRRAIRPAAGLRRARAWCRSPSAGMTLKEDMKALSRASPLQGAVAGGRRVVRGGAAVHPSRPLRPGDFADLLLLA